MDALQFRLTKLQQEFDSQLNVCDQLNTENQNRAVDLKVCYHLCLIHGVRKTGNSNLHLYLTYVHSAQMFSNVHLF